MTEGDKQATAEATAAGAQQATAESGTTGDQTDQRPLSKRYSAQVDRFIRGVEVVAASVFAVLFAIGVIDLVIQILLATRTGRITDPNVVIGFIDTGLLLLIIVEVYQTVLAYVEETDTRRIVRLVIYTGVIAMVRKAIIFRTGEYATEQQALLAAGSYALLIFALVSLLFAERVYGESDLFAAD